MSLVFQFAKSLLTQKLRDRFRTYANFDKLTENVPISILPAEAGGQVPMAVMIDQWKAVLEERQETILSLDQVEYGIENSNPDSTLPTSETSEPAVTSKTSTTSKNDLKKKKASTTSKKQKSQSTTSSEVIDVMSSVCKIEMST